MRLQQLADVTGGEAFFPTTTKQLDRCSTRIVSQVRAQYSLGFISTDAQKDGTLAQAGRAARRATQLQNLRIRTRKGYYAAVYRHGRHGRRHSP